MLKRIQNKELTIETTITERFLAGAIAGFLSQTTVYPLDVIITVLLFLWKSLFFFQFRC